MDDISISFLSSLLLLGGFQGIFLSFLLLFLRKKNFLANRYLAALLGFLGLTLLHQFLVDSNYIVNTPFLLGVTMPLDLFYAPSVFLYVRTMTRPSELNQKTWLHYVPSLFCTLLLSPFYFYDFDTKLDIVHKNYLLEQWPGIMDYTYPVVALIMAIQFSVYMFLAFKLLFEHTKTISQFFSYKENITLSWLRNFLLLMVVFWVFLMLFLSLFTIDSKQAVEESSTLFIWLYSFSFIFILYVGVMGLLQRRIYHPTISIDDIQPIINPLSVINDEVGKLDVSGDIDDRLNHKISSKEGCQTNKKGKYKKSALTSDMSEHILNRLKTVMEHDKPYLENNLTLPNLAKIVSTSPNYLSQVINEQLQLNFFDYINAYRIEMAKELMINPLPHTHTILDIAMESAFNSKSAFYSAFKKQMGITPAEFKKSHSQ